MPNTRHRHCLHCGRLLLSIDTDWCDESCAELWDKSQKEIIGEVEPPLVTIEEK